MSVNKRIDQKDASGSYLIPNHEYRKLLKELLTLDPEQRITIEEFYEKFKQLPIPDPE